MLSNQPQVKAENVESHEDELALLTKNFHKFLKKAGKQTKSRFFGSKASKGKSSFKPLDFSNKKGVQCRECEGYGHLQSECANTHNKKSKATMTSVWSDDD